MDECKRMGIDVKVPDINESLERFSVTKKGEIRFGLAAVKGVGANAVTAVIHERKANGPFKDIYDFVERVNLTACNRSAIENLALSGAFDCFGIPREAYVEKVNDASWADMLVKYGQNIQNDKNSLQASLFGDLEPIETAKPPIPPFQPWSDLQRLEEEKKMVTIYISAHPLDPYYMLINYACNCTCGDFEEKKEAGTELTIGGMVTGFAVRTGKSGKDFGMLEIEDFTGKLSVPLFGKTFDSYRNAISVGDFVRLTLIIAQSRFKPDRLDINLENVEHLDKIENRADVVTIFIDTEFKSQDFFRELSQFQHRNGRSGDLFMDISDMESKQSIRIHSRKRYDISKDLVKMLEEWGVPFRVSDSQNLR